MTIHNSQSGRARAAAVALGLAGALPFIALVGAILAGPDWRTVSSVAVIPALIAYGAVILSFLGGINWGIALGQPDHAGTPFLLSVIPSLLAWAALLLPPMLALVLLSACFVGQFLLDHYLPMARWFRLLRATLTVVVTLSLVTALLALLT